jgi:DNA-binding response OmpR family regulator
MSRATDPPPKGRPVRTAAPSALGEPQWPRGASESDSEAAVPTLLVVDVEGTFRALLVHLLIVSGYRVLQAGDADTALGVAEAQGDELALLVLDLELPGGGGVALARRLRARIPGLPVLFLSAADPYGAPPREDSAGAAYLTKPFSLAVLLATVQRLLREPPPPPAPS